MDIRDSASTFQPNDPTAAFDYFKNKMTFTTGPVELSAALKRRLAINVIDVREPKDYAEGHLPGAKSLPKDQWETLAGLSQDRLNVIYCYTSVCHLAARAATYFAAKGFPVMELEGGFATWKRHMLRIEPGTGEQKPATVDAEETVE